ncbi:CrcB family protein [uncultured Pseudokineococcus sp.]|uniref:FluC/FEX family fluoride channel n=1 Tax=uncultured Pseudokineococcus sp. TaxID=1642928 RepID=UPI002603B330|nr:CrcB family protein [uncultured Pseudokineococcus sp.]
MRQPLTRPPHRSPALLLGVLVGGAAGTGLRWAVGQVLPHQAGAWPWGTLLVNVVGALLLGALLEALVRAGPDVGRRRAARVVLGSGLLGGLTTTSALALETVQLGASGAPRVAVAYAVTSLVAGVAAAAAGVGLVRRGPGAWGPGRRGARA